MTPVGRFAPAARVGFQVHFVERAPDMTTIGGRLLADAAQGLDVMVIDVAVMDGDWRREVRAEVIDEGSWGSGGGVLSILSLLESGVFSEEQAKAIRTAMGA
ncbi:hypothetical protein GCM10022403_083130 [Streptomyces coacervatus]|uniref:Uncharacterized protein n=1 Tax=Streptomyces coacervatus TaxID=647381 RepID=A0ABP7JA74_9ACTN|nr:hypothetical protein [Streptomyces coacervatus]MDF2270328.1 hypothetical protein [Streptomyces coacervatus]